MGRLSPQFISFPHRLSYSKGGLNLIPRASGWDGRQIKGMNQFLLRRVTIRIRFAIFLLSVLAVGGILSCRLAPVQVAPQYAVKPAPVELPQIPPPDSGAAEVPAG